MVEQKSERLSNEDNLRHLVEEHFAYLSEKNSLSGLMDIIRDKHGKRIREIAEISGIGASEDVKNIFNTVFTEVVAKSTGREEAFNKLGEVYEGNVGMRMNLASMTLNTLWDIREENAGRALN